jgi:hypothetical protein
MQGPGSLSGVMVVQANCPVVVGPRSDSVRTWRQQAFDDDISSHVLVKEAAGRAMLLHAVQFGALLAVYFADVPTWQIQACYLSMFTAERGSNAQTTMVPSHDLHLDHVSWNGYTSQK